MKVAFIGLGSMGAPIARHILEAGHDLTVYNRTESKAKPLLDAGAQWADSPRQVVRDAECLVTMLSDDMALNAVLMGEGGALEGMEKDTVHVSMSTLSVEYAQQVFDYHHTLDVNYVAAPVFGRPDMAEAKKLWVLAAGPRKGIEAARPIMEAAGQGVIDLGDNPTAANSVKLAGNFMIAAMMETLGEAFAFVRKSGVGAEPFLEIMNGKIFRSPIYENYGSQIAQGRFEPAGFRLSLGLKDLRFVLAAAQAVGAPMPLASLIHDNYLGAVARGMGDLDWSALARVASANAGLGDVDADD